MLPPCVKVIDHHLHHTVFGPFFLIISLQNKSACADREDGDVAVEQFLEAERFVEGFARVEVHCRNEGSCRFRAAWNHHLGCPPALVIFVASLRYYRMANTQSLGHSKIPFDRTTALGQERPNEAIGFESASPPDTVARVV